MVDLVAGRQTDDDGIVLEDQAQFPWQRPTSDTPEAVGTGTPADSTPPDPMQSAARISDGSRLWTVDGTSLTVINATGSTPRVGTVLQLPTVNAATRWDSALLLGNRLLAIAPGERNHLYHSEPAGSPPDAIDYQTHLALVDVSQPDRPRLLGSETITGWVVDADAELDQHAFRVVLSTSPDHRLAQRRQFLLTAAEAKTFAPTAWLPDRQVRDAAGTVLKDGPLLPCTDVWAPATDSGLDVVSALSIDPTAADPFLAAPAFGVIAGGGMASATNGRVYVASAKAWGIQKPRRHKGFTPSPAPPLEARSSIHEFDVSAEPAYRGSVGIDGFVDATGALSARQTSVRVLTSDRPPWRYDVLKARAAHHAVTVIDAAPRLTIRGRTGVDMPARTTSVIRWFDDLLALAAQRAPNGGWGSDEKSAGPLRLVALPDLGPPRDLATLDLPGDEAALFKVDAGRLGAVGERARPKGLDPHSVEMYSIDVHDPAAPTLTDAVSYGNGEGYDTEAVHLGRRTLLTSRGFVTEASTCPVGIRCVNHAPPCYPELGCDSIPNTDVNGVIVDEIGVDGRLRQVGWLIGADAVAAVGDRLLALSDKAVSYLDPKTLKPTATATF
jgi:hypothetical protein